MNCLDGWKIFRHFLFGDKIMWKKDLVKFVKKMTIFYRQYANFLAYGERRSANAHPGFELYQNYKLVRYWEGLDNYSGQDLL